MFFAFFSPPPLLPCPIQLQGLQPVMEQVVRKASVGELPHAPSVLVRSDSIGALPQVRNCDESEELLSGKRSTSAECAQSATGDDGESTYEGECNDAGVPHGHGKLSFLHDVDFYAGEFKEGAYHGKGKRVYADGNMYEGEFVDGKRCGQGKLTLINGETYEGGYKSGKKHGHGKSTYANNNVYVGDYCEGKRHGQ